MFLVLNSFDSNSKGFFLGNVFHKFYSRITGVRATLNRLPAIAADSPIIFICARPLCLKALLTAIFNVLYIIMFGIEM